MEGAVVVGGLSAIGAAITSIDIPHDSVVQYETATKADDFLVMAHGSRTEVERGAGRPGTMHPKQLDMHPHVEAASTAREAVAV